MKTNKTQAAASFIFDFSPCEDAMLHHYNSGITLSDAVTSVWNSAPDAMRQIKPFRDQFTTWALKAKYGETHIRRVLGSFDFLTLRKKTGKANATKAAKKAAKSSDPVVTVAGLEWEIKLLLKAGKKAEIKKLLTGILASL